MDAGNWREMLPQESREGIVNKIMETLERHVPFSGQEGLQELGKIAVRSEEMIYSSATSQSDYLSKISLKMLTMETISQNPPNSLPANPTNNSNNPTDPALLDSTAQTGNANGEDWQEEICQKIKAMKEMYLPELNYMYQQIAGKLQQHDSLPWQPKNEQLEKLKVFKTRLEHIITFLQVPKDNIAPSFKEKIGPYEKQIIYFLHSIRPCKPNLPLWQGQLPTPCMHSMQQTQQPQSQITQVQPHENQMQAQMPSMNLQGSVPMLQQNNVTSLQHNSLSSLSGISNEPQNMVISLQSSSSMDSGQGNPLRSLQQVAVGSLQQNPMSAPQQVNINSLSSENGMNALQSNLNMLQSNSNTLEHQLLKQQQEQQMLQTQQLKQQFQERQMQQQLMHKQQLLQQQPAQLQAHQLPHLHQMNDVNDLEKRQQMGVKSGVFHQHHSAGQRSAYQHQQLKSGTQCLISSPQLLQVASPQVPQHPSSQINQKNVPTSLTKAGTPLQSANSPFVVPSPSTPLDPSPIPGESEKVNFGVSSLSNAGNIGHQQIAGALAPAQSFAVGTAGISTSPLLAEFTSPDANHANVSTVVSGKSSVTEHPLEHLIKMEKSMSRKALSASVSDIGSVVSIIDMIAGSAPGNGSRAAVGEDLFAMTECCLQKRNFITQDGTTGTRKMRRYTSAMPLNVVSSAGSITDGFEQLTGLEVPDLSSTTTSSTKRPRIEASHALLEEISEINQQLIDTMVDISDEDVDPIAAAAAASEGGEGIIVKCSFCAVALNPNSKSQYASAQMSQTLRLLIPANYPNCSPILLDKFPIEVSEEYDDLSVKVMSRFSISLRSLSQPMSLGEMARTWDACTRAVTSEYAQQSGGGSFNINIWDLGELLECFMIIFLAYLHCHPKIR
ncbi:hypothetical protein F0562_021672 [Nyssa sinensis]|uniref:Mediator complex subunit 15 KIX domain-containing protein n=1 Tax=Nyssa sinensis TaxID=561372 RepID=A0A5J5BPD5_9ASTE|nr:hypothetical protein F0562_021672 [Nyssa sinensis]